jgi:hypothetical protein
VLKKIVVLLLPLSELLLGTQPAALVAELGSRALREYGLESRLHFPLDRYEASQPNSVEFPNSCLE